jgi:hypothetical protein
MTTYALVPLTPADRLGLEAFADMSGLHADLVRRLVALGLVEASVDDAGRMWVPVSQLGVVGRIQRLRADFALNYAAVGLVIDLLDRVAALERSLAEPAATRAADRGGRSWT